MDSSGLAGTSTLWPGGRGSLIIPYWPFQFTALLVHRIAFCEDVGDHNFDNKAVVCGYHNYYIVLLFSVNSHAQRGHVKSRIQLQ